MSVELSHDDDIACARILKAVNERHRAGMSMPDAIRAMPPEDLEIVKRVAALVEWPEKKGGA